MRWLAPNLSSSIGCGKPCARAIINQFLTHLAVKEKVSASTQNQALSALLFLYRYVLDREIGDFGEVIRARKSIRMPVVMTREEVKAVLNHLTGNKWLMASLMYGAGLRLMECLRLRVQDVVPFPSASYTASIVVFGVLSRSR